MRKLVLAAIAGLATLSCAAVALALPTWPAVTVKPTVTPNRAGTARHPQGVKLKAQINWQNLGPANQPIVTQFHLLFPKGAKYNGAHTPSCGRSKINFGPSHCPKASIMGTGSGVAFADQTPARPKITVVNGGGNTVYFYTVLNNPAYVHEPVIGHVTHTGGKWSYELNVTVPESLRFVAGVPIRLTTLTVTAGKGSWLETTGCSGGRWPFQITTDYLNYNTGATGSTTDASSLKCHR
jgi:hypothetical protein